MRYHELRKAALDIETELDRASRTYSLGHPYAAHVMVGGISGVRREEAVPGIEPDLVVQISALEFVKGDEITEADGYEYADLDQLPSSALVKFAEIRGIVDAWKASSLPDLPPSTAEEYRSRIRRVHRRRRRNL